MIGNRSKKVTTYFARDAKCNTRSLPSIQPSGFYAWQTELIRQACNDSGPATLWVYSCRKLHDDVLDQGETSCPNRVARLTKLAGIKAGYPGQAAAAGRSVKARRLDQADM